VIVRAGERTWCGSVADLRDADVDSDDVATAVRGADGPVQVHCPTPGPLFDRVGHVHPEMGLRIRTALAVAARTRGLTPPQNAEIERLRAERDEIAIDEQALQHADPPDDDPRALRERVAELRGRIQALEASDRDASDEKAELRQAAARLSEAQTTRIAAAETRRDARTERDRRERRLRLEDRIANRERDARSWLVERVREPYERVVFALDPGADPFDCPPPIAALGILRVADQRGPVVLATDQFPSPAAAASWIEGPVVRCRPDV
jgi:hypothetical protein